MIIALPLFLSVSAFAEDWPQYHGNNSDKISTESIASQSWGEPKVLWKVDTPDGFSSFVVADGHSFTIIKRNVEGIDREVCVALDSTTGKEVWAVTLGLTRYGHDGGGRGTPDNRGGDGPRSTPAYNEGNVYVLDSDQTLVCLSAKTGQEIWKHDLAKEFNGRNIKWKNAASPLVEGGHVYVFGGGAGESLLAFNKTTGAVAWKSGDYLMTHATPVATTIHGVRQIIFFVQSGLVSVSPDRGKELWSYPFPFQTSTAASPVVAGDIVYCAAGYGVGSAAVKISKRDDSFEAEELWRHEGNNPVTNH